MPPFIEPPVARRLADVFIDYAVAILPAIELAVTDAEPGKELRTGRLAPFDQRFT